MRKDETIRIPLTVEMIDELAGGSPDVDEHPEDYWFGYVPIIAQLCAPNDRPQMISVPTAFFKREFRQLNPDSDQVAVWVCEGRAYRHSALLQTG